MTEVGNVYGQALYSLAHEEKLDEAILQELKVLDAAFSAEPDYLRLLSVPNLSKAERCGVLDQDFRDKVHPYVLNFLKILTEKGYAKHFSDCVRGYESQFDLDHGILPVQAVTAVALNEAQREKLSAKLAAITGKTVRLINRVDPGCMGGVRLDYDGKRVDDTVAHRLAAVGKMLKSTVL